MSKSNRKILLTILAGFILAYVILLTVFWKETQAYAVREAQKLVQDALFTHRAVHTYVTKTQRPEIYRLQGEGKLYKEYFSPEVMSFTFVARNVQKLVNEERAKASTQQVYFKLASDNPRNPINQADEWESRLLKRFNSEKIEEFREVSRDKDGRDQLYFAMPIGVNTPGCLKCHSDPKLAPPELLAKYGDKAGFWEDPGVIRALISIRVPLDAYLSNAKRIFQVLAIVTLAAFALMFLSVFYFLRRIDRQEQMLIQSEKMASLGRLVAGFAHEINTPIGVAVGSSTLALESAGRIRKMLSQEDVNEDELVSELQSIDKSCQLTFANLNRAAGLVRSFKRTSVDQTRGEERTYHLRETLEDVVTSLREVLKNSPVTVDVVCPPELSTWGRPGALDQIITNLINNSLLHGFDKGSKPGKITISAKQEGNNIVLDYRDTGKGMDERTRQKIFEPFFTTARDSGGSGLGMFVCYNVATTELGGSIELASAPGEGVHVTLRYPFAGKPAASPAA
jgi:signal transduction histidine kinase